MGQKEPPLEIVVEGVIDLNEDSFTTDRPVQPEIAILSRGKREIPKIALATLKWTSGREDYLRNIQIRNIYQHQWSGTTTYEYVKTTP